MSFGYDDSSFFFGLVNAVFFDLLLAGDNALVIGMAARKLPQQKRRRVIMWGVALAIVLRTVLSLLAMELLDLPWLRLAGGLLLILIGIKLLVENHKDDVNSLSEDRKQSQGMGAAVGTILTADVVMSLDNVLAVAASANGCWMIILIALIVSIPIMVWGSQLVSRWVNRFPWLNYVGSALLAVLAVNLIKGEPSVDRFLQSLGSWFLYVVLYPMAIIFTLAAGYGINLWCKRRYALQQQKRKAGRESAS
ncbi:TerC family protein [Pasteuria penetrans]|uniref:TerC family protein n=1 Tax=Pasteuria penetrans TaxID=86005 RepID=UPI000FA358FB|nr:TerC family protein [Pasteuria penetrans]